MPCRERDRIILAFALAVNDQNNASSTLDEASDDAERGRLKDTMAASRDYCHELREMLLTHCQRHGC